MWTFPATAEMAVPLIDEGVAKLTPEFLVHGHACAPRPSDPMRWRCARASARATRRCWSSASATGTRAPPRPRPFESMPLDWAARIRRPRLRAQPARPRAARHRTACSGCRTWSCPRRACSGPTRRCGAGRLRRARPRCIRSGPPCAAPTTAELHRAARAGLSRPTSTGATSTSRPADQWMDAPSCGDEPLRARPHASRTAATSKARLPGLRVRAFAGYNGRAATPKLARGARCG